VETSQDPNILKINIAVRAKLVKGFAADTQGESLAPNVSVWRLRLGSPEEGAARDHRGGRDVPAAKANRKELRLLGIGQDRAHDARLRFCLVSGELTARLVPLSNQNWHLRRNRRVFCPAWLSRSLLVRTDGTAPVPGSRIYFHLRSAQGGRTAS
jgi:hypothetical protein